MVATNSVYTCTCTHIYKQNGTCKLQFSVEPLQVYPPHAPTKNNKECMHAYGPAQPLHKNTKILNKVYLLIKHSHEIPHTTFYTRST